MSIRSKENGTPGTVKEIAAILGVSEEQVVNGWQNMVDTRLKKREKQLVPRIRNGLLDLRTEIQEIAMNKKKEQIIERHEKKLGQLRLKRQKRLDDLEREVIGKGDLAIRRDRLVSEAQREAIGSQRKIESDMERVGEIAHLVGEKSVMAVSYCLEGVWKLGKVAGNLTALTVTGVAEAIKNKRKKP